MTRAKVAKWRLPQKFAHQNENNLATAEAIFSTISIRLSLTAFGPVPMVATSDGQSTSQWSGPFNQILLNNETDVPATRDLQAYVWLFWRIIGRACV
jgi:hypothetical protein